jgi:hypothetical protein
MFDVDRLFKGIAKLQVRPQGLLYLYLKYADENRGMFSHLSMQPLAYIYKYDSFPGFGEGTIKDLIEKNYLVLHNTELGYALDNLKLTKFFYDTIGELFMPVEISNMDANEERFETFFLTYPAFTDNFNDPKKPKIPIKAVNKKELFAMFREIVKTEADFEKLMSSTKSAKKKKALTMNIIKWLTSEMWKEYTEDDTTHDSTYITL